MHFRLLVSCVTIVLAEEFVLLSTSTAFPRFHMGHQVCLHPGRLQNGVVPIFSRSCHFFLNRQGRYDAERNKSHTSRRSLTPAGEAFWTLPLGKAEGGPPGPIRSASGECIDTAPIDSMRLPPVTEFNTTWPADGRPAVAYQQECNGDTSQSFVVHITLWCSLGCGCDSPWCSNVVIQSLKNPDRFGQNNYKAA